MGSYLGQKTADDELGMALRLQDDSLQRLNTFDSSLRSRTGLRRVATNGRVEPIRDEPVRVKPIRDEPPRRRIKPVVLRRPDPVIISDPVQEPVKPTTTKKQHKKEKQDSEQMKTVTTTTNNNGADSDSSFEFKWPESVEEATAMLKKVPTKYYMYGCGTLLGLIILKRITR